MKNPDGTGIRKIYVASYLKEGEWVLIYQQNVADAFSQPNKAHRAKMAILLLGGFGIVSAALLVSRRIFRRFERSDQGNEIMNKQMRQTGKLASVGELAAGIVHESNNPVAIMVEKADLDRRPPRRRGASVRREPRGIQTRPPPDTEPGETLQGDHAQTSELRP